MQNYIDKHFRHYSDSLWLIRVFLIIFVDLIYNLLIFIFSIEKSKTILTIFFIIIPSQSTYMQFVFYLKPFYRNLIFVGLISIYCFLSKVIMSFLIFNHLAYLNIIYMCMTFEIIFHFIWICIGIFSEIRYQRLLEIAKHNEEMENLIV
jgi:hypothetical protein